MGTRADDSIGFSGHRWPQYQEEIQAFIQLLKDEGCTSYLEIGCRYGDTWHAVGMALPKGSKLVGVDLPGTRSGIIHSHRDSGIYLERAAKDLCKHGRNSHVIIGNSHDQRTIKKAAALAPFDAVFIDGDHTPKGVREDLANYGPMARIIALHDIHGQGNNTRHMMAIFKEFAEGKKSMKFVHDGLRRGIGVFWT